MTLEYGEVQQQTMEFGDVKAFRIAVTDCTFMVQRAQGTPQLLAEGTADFLADLQAYCEDGILTVKSTAKQSAVSLVGIVKAAAGLGRKSKGEGSLLLSLPADIDGEIRVNGSGDGEVLIPLGRLEVMIHGSGDVDVQQVQQLDAAVSGSGDITVGRVTGRANVAVDGSGDVGLSSGELEELSVAVHGSGDVDAHVKALRASLRVHGSGDITVDHVVEDVERQVRGSGEIIVHKTGA